MIDSINTSNLGCLKPSVDSLNKGGLRFDETESVFTQSVKDALESKETNTDEAQLTEKEMKAMDKAAKVAANEQSEVPSAVSKFLISNLFGPIGTLFGAINLHNKVEQKENLENQYRSDFIDMTKYDNDGIVE